MELMVPHHRSAVAMAELAVERAQHPQVRGLAQGIVSAQEAEIARMGAWHERWFGEPLSPDDSGPHGRVDMSQLESAGDDLDRVLLGMMIPHHASAISMARERHDGRAAAGDRDPRRGYRRGAGEGDRADAGWREQWYPPRG